MAGDWIPMRVDLADDPAVIAIAGAIGLDEMSVVGRLHRLWSWANKHLADGNARGVSPEWIDRYTATAGLAAALLDAGWLRSRSGAVEFPNFERWNSKGAKRRLLTAQRVRKSRESIGNAPGVTRALPEKRREEKSNKEPPPPPAEPGGGDSAEPLKTPGKKARKPDVASVPIPAELETPEFRSAWEEWLGDRRDRGKTVTAKAAVKQLAALIPLGSVGAIECINRSIRNSWTGLFPDRVNPAAPQPSSPAAGVVERVKDRYRSVIEATQAQMAAREGRECPTPTGTPSGSTPTAPPPGPPPRSPPC